MTKLEQTGSPQFGHGMILDILEYDIVAGERYNSTCNYSTTENSASHEWLPLPWLQFEMNKVESYPIARSMTQICIRLRSLSSSHTALPRFHASDLRAALMTTFTCHGKVYHVVSEHVHWVVAMQDHAQIKFIYIIYIYIYTPLPVSHVLGAHSGLLRTTTTTLLALENMHAYTNNYTAQQLAYMHMQSRGI